MIQKTANNKNSAKKDKFQELEEEADKNFREGNLKKALEKYLVLQGYYNIYKDMEKEASIAKNLIKVYVYTANEYLESNEKSKRNDNDLIKKAVYRLMDAIDISQKYKFDSTTDKLYKNAIKICTTYRLLKLKNEIEKQLSKYIENNIIK
jgi:hypothetical protein